MGRSRNFAIVGIFILGCSGRTGDASDTSGGEDAAARYAETLCEALEACECVSRFETGQDCSQHYSERFSDALNDGLSLDETCLDDTLASNFFQACPDNKDADPSIPDCWTLDKPAGAGEPCTYRTDLPGLKVRSCSEGLGCYEGICRADAPGDHEDGSPCLYSEPSSCHDWNLYCGLDDKCLPVRLLDESCDSPWACDAGLYCQGLEDANEGVCSWQASMGEACDPFAWQACDPEVPSSYCDPDAGTCVESGPSLCYVMGWPFSY